jgi:hypothetical protein
MSSSVNTPSNSSQTSQRIIASLPLRRKNSARSESRSTSSSYHALTPESTNPAESIHNDYLSPNAASSPAPVLFGQFSGNSPAEEPINMFTFRALHNITPLPSRTDSSDRLPVPVHVEGFGVFASRDRATDQEQPQPLHSLFTDEKVLVDDTIDAPPDNEPYNVRDEIAPAGQYFSPLFQAALQRSLGIAKKAASAIEGAKNNFRRTDNDLNRLLNDAMELHTFESTNTRTVGVLGDSGEGEAESGPNKISFCSLAQAKVV